MGQWFLSQGYMPCMFKDLTSIPTSITPSTTEEAAGAQSIVNKHCNTNLSIELTIPIG